MWTVIEKFYTPRTICSRFFIRRKYEKNFLTKYNYVVRMKTTDAYTLGNELRELGLIKSHNQISLHQWKYKFESEGLSGFIDLKGKGPKPPKKRRVKNEDK